jgi:hypothetical protein
MSDLFLNACGRFHRLGNFLAQEIAVALAKSVDAGFDGGLG